MRLNGDTLLIIGVFGAGLLLSGAAIDRAWRMPYIGLGAGLSLGLWLACGLAYATPFGWSVWVGDVALLAVGGLIALGGWLRRDAPRPTLAAYARFDLALLAVVLMGLAAPALVLPVPLDTDAQGFGYLALMARLGGDLTALAPFQPEIDYLYAPGFTVTVAYLSERLATPLHSTQFGVGAMLAWWVVLVPYDFGHLLAGRVRARAHLLAAWVGLGLFTAYMDSHYTSLYGLAFGGCFLAWVYVYLFADATPLGRRWAFGAAALSLAALVLVHPDTTIIIGLGFGAWLLLMPLGHPHPTRRAWLTVTGGVPLAALVLLLPWLWNVRGLLGSEIASPFSRDPVYWRVALSFPPELLYHGGVIAWVALLGAVIGVWRRSQAALLAVGWMVLILEFAAFGALEALAPWLVAPIVRYDYPFSIAWHGPIIPYVLLGGGALAWAWRRLGALDVRRVGYGLLGVVAVGIVLASIFHQPIIAASKGRVTFFGAFASAADVRAMGWLREQTAPDAYVLNFPGPQEGDWVPVIAERRSVYYRPQPFFNRPGDPLADTEEQQALRAFWSNPADPAHADLLRNMGVDYVIVPQVVGNPASFADHVRWRRPFTDLIAMQSEVSAAPYLKPVFDADGAAVYRVE